MTRDDTICAVIAEALAEVLPGVPHAPPDTLHGIGFVRGLPDHIVTTGVLSVVMPPAVAPPGLPALSHWGVNVGNVQGNGPTCADALRAALKAHAGDLRETARVWRRSAVRRGALADDADERAAQVLDAMAKP